MNTPEDKRRAIDEFWKRAQELKGMGLTAKQMKKEMMLMSRELSIKVGYLTTPPPQDVAYSADKAKRISIYIYPAQLKMIEKISKKRKKTKRQIFLEAIQSYIGAFLKDEV